MTANERSLQVLALCPECRNVFRHPGFVRNAYRCFTCDVPRQVAVVTPGGERHALLTEDGLYRRLSVLAESRNGQIGARYLEEEHPELLANCLAHAGRYRTARRRLRRWLGRHRGSPPPASEDETFPYWSAPGAVEGLEPTPGPAASAPPPGQTAKIAAIALRVRSRSARLDDRCPYCHDVFEDADHDGQPDHAFLCDCGALFHVECRVELERCTTLGCEAAFDPDRAGGEEGDEGPVIRVVERSSGEEAPVTLSLAQASAVGTAITAVAAIAIAALVYTLILVFK